MTTESLLSEIPTDQDPRWVAVAARDRAFDGKFCYSVETNGVFCRPSCAARPVKPGNVRLHATCAGAEKAGFRPCNRCKPDQPSPVRSGIGNDTQRLSRRRREHRDTLCRGRVLAYSILVARNDRGVCAILLGDDPDALARDLQHRFPRAGLVGGDAGCENLVAKVVGLVEAPAIGFDLPLDIRGTAFQQRVWQALREIPAGATASYANIADQIGSPRSIRAVAQACAANGIAAAIPCHRVVGTDGALSGYRWGVERKRTLLEREAAA